METVQTNWDRPTLESRIASFADHRRHAGGSPDASEIAAYARALPASGPDATAVVLGMTPELRTLALSRFKQCFAADNNPASISVYRDWIPTEDRRREQIIEIDWLKLGGRLPELSITAVLADAVFGNLLLHSDRVQLLKIIAGLLAPGGRLVMRTPMIPDGFDPAPNRADVLLNRFREGEIDEAEFGFGMRLVGHHESCHDPRTLFLDNAALFAACDRRLASGEISASEHEIINRYFFAGKNWIPSQREWESLLTSEGWKFRLHRCTGRIWYDWYPIYECER